MFRVPLIALIVLTALVLPAAATAKGGPPPGLVQGHIVDYAKPPGPPGGGGGSAEPTAMVTDFKLAKQHWLSSPVQYKVDERACPVNGCTNPVNAGFDAWQPTSGISFNESNNPSQTNPCTGGPNRVYWGSIDGPGNVLAQTFPCYFLGTNQMAGFETEFDSADPWSTCTTACSGSVFPIQATATHEAGHVVGLLHVRAPRDARLTMFPFITPGDFGFATLGCGDQLGTAKQYGTSFACSTSTVPLD